MREEILLLESRGKYSGKTGAIVRWDAFRNVLRPHVEKSEAMKEMYWEATYHLVETPAKFRGGWSSRGGRLWSWWSP